MIWGNLRLDYKDWRDDLEYQYPDLSENERLALMHEINAEYLSDVREKLDIQIPAPILVCADLGLWDGRKTGYRIIESGNIKDCFYSLLDYNEWFVDRRGDLRCTAVHHDGTNYYLYRAIKESTTDNQVERLKNKLYAGTAARSDITRLTRRLGDEIAKVYGFSISKQKRQELQR